MKPRLMSSTSTSTHSPPSLDLLVIDALNQHPILIEKEHINTLLHNTTGIPRDLTPHPHLPLQLIHTSLLNIESDACTGTREPRDVRVEGVDGCVVVVFDLNKWGDVGEDGGCVAVVGEGGEDLRGAGFEVEGGVAGGDAA